MLMLQLSMGPNMAMRLPCSLEICPSLGYKVPAAAVRFKGMCCGSKSVCHSSSARVPVCSAGPQLWYAAITGITYARCSMLPVALTTQDGSAHR